ncbi:MAG TPA: exopolyphosphatase [Actinobacteria bacterium]|nr:exopolyphosphatase [Actinomycetota bacterium]
MTQTVAAIDCGTNSIRLLVADLDADGRLHDRDRRMRIVRLGEAVDATGMISEAALQRAFLACDEFAEVIESFAATKVRFVATSASRDAKNRQVFVDGVRARLALEPEVIPGEVEAALSFDGATSGLPSDATAPFLMVDIGGGSTEFVLGRDAPQQSISVDMGCVRMTERFLASDPPTTDQIRAVTEFIDELIGIAAQQVDLGAAKTLIGLAGSVTTVAAIALELPEYDPHRIHGARVSRAQVHAIAKQLLAMTRTQRAAMPVMHEGRVDVIAGGAVILDRIMERVGLDEVLVSEHDILDGIARSLR